MQTSAYQFGRFRLLPEERQLLVDGAPAKLGARAFDLLLALLERRSRTVTRAELFELVWPGRIVEDQNLQVQVVALRKLLGPNAIATIPGRGYRFALPLDEEQPVATAPAPSRPSAAPLTNLPAELPLLYGRTQDIVAVLQLLSEHRLVTLAGPGGIGKTRLAQAVAHQLRTRYADGVWLVELAALTDGELIAAGVARTFGFAPEKEMATVDGVARALSPLSALLVLDNCEHLIGAAGAFVAALRRAAPRIDVLATSQEPLRVDGEQVMRLGPLAVPDRPTAAQAAEYGAVSLFAARAQAVAPKFRLTDDTAAVVIDICRRLDGIPLALELAAARVPLLGVEGVRARLDERFRLLTAGSRDAPARQQTLRNALDWSHGLLSVEQQTVFRRLGVFAGSFALDAAQRVVGDEAIDEWAVLDQLGALVDKSLVQVLDGAAPRYRLLESARAFALERLEAAGEARRARTRLARALVDWFDRADAEYLATPAFDWLARAEPELDNTREALRWACGVDGDRALAIELAGASVGLWVLLDLVDEAGALFDRIEPWLDANTAPARAARFWLALAQIGGTGVARAVPPGRACAAARQALALYRGLGDRLHQYWALNFLIPLAERAGEHLDTAQAIAEMRSLLDPGWGLHVGRLLRATEARQLARAGRWADYRDAFSREMELLERHGDLRAAWLAAQSLALAQLRLGDADGAVAVLQRVVGQVRDAGRLRQAWSLLGLLASALIEQGDTARSAPVVREFVALVRSAGSLAWGIDYLSTYVAQCGRWEDAARLHGWSDAQAAARGETRGPVIREAHARLREQLQARFGPDRCQRLCHEGAGLGEDDVAALICPEAAAGQRQ